MAFFNVHGRVDEDETAFEVWQQENWVDWSKGDCVGCILLFNYYEDKLTKRKTYYIKIFQKGKSK